MEFASITPGECAEKIRTAGSIAVLTGAGISTAAGVPDFRGPYGLYVTRAYDPEKVFEISAFDRDPKPFYRFSRDFLGLLASIQPTFTHRFLVSLEQEGKKTAVITQNIDGLHQRAGSRRVFPVHGDYETAHCRRCRRSCGKEELLRRMQEAEVPVCGHCGGVLKPDVVFFGESVLYLTEAQSLCAASDLMLVLGSSLSVYPAAALPSCAGGEVVIVSQGEVGIRPAANVFLAETGLDEFFRETAAALGQPAE